jgi:hypothetical protein
MVEEADNAAHSLDPDIDCAELPLNSVAEADPSFSSASHFRACFGIYLDFVIIPAEIRIKPL